LDDATSRADVPTPTRSSTARFNPRSPGVDDEARGGRRRRRRNLSYLLSQSSFPRSGRGRIVRVPRVMVVAVVVVVVVAIIRRPSNASTKDNDEASQQRRR
jgi:hypothetical protein